MPIAKKTRRRRRPDNTVIRNGEVLYLQCKTCFFAETIAFHSDGSPHFVECRYSAPRAMPDANLERSFPELNVNTMWTTKNKKRYFVAEVVLKSIGMDVLNWEDS
jgi:hypothetical protein